ncbi:unnamed protein product (macronuclear) [Paramecium tetraurelia]|uniref:Uncharacterized protein n=1 Tax=Paramecium tetraurelia TaxID=5888 RepID=A0E304_PARTE|nr:uncharacterized protein GSPATT00022844001 [Paramecium tetraurelia]CAK89671.1 unnamed protein product [Paramecium tetraurelia]|eukprot:XP_001457068.1 hypothetical protein (macronuclear) [Paramecium tetraurelia strain d4-2]
MRKHLISEPNFITSPYTEREEYKRQSPYFYNNCISNRHVDCQGEVYDKRDLSNASKDKQLLKPETVRQNNRLKSKPAVTRLMKKQIITNFIENKKLFYSVTPMQPIYDQFKQRYEQRERDRKFQNKHFDKTYKHHLSRAIQYTLQQILNFLSFDDVFKVRLDRQDYDRYLRRQPKLLQNSVTAQDLLILQTNQMENELTSNRKIQLLKNVFSDPHFDAKDREILYQVLKFQISQAQKQVAKLEKASMGIKGLNRFQNKKEGHLEQLAIIIDFLQNNYEKLVKLL